ncbi:DUF2478 domain-containing protein [bacterium]|nr:DUF2478 domain-containing protein [bacterium]
MRIAYTMAPGRGDTDLLLAGIAQALKAEGYRACGTVQINSSCDNDGPCDMDVKVLPDGPVIRISQSLGKGARGCRLDAGALETSIALCEAQLVKADVLIVNKFGKQEASGRGFRGLIGEALVHNLPVLVGLNGMNKHAFQEFTGGEAVALEAKAEPLMAWLTRALTRDQTVA